MNEKQQQLLFDKGITNVPSDALCSDNALEESIGMVYDDGEHRVIQNPDIYINTGRYNGTTSSAPFIIYIHKLNGKENLIGYRATNNRLIWGEKENSTFVQKGGLNIVHTSDTKITSIGKTLILADENGMHYIKWDGELTQYRNLSATFPEIKFDAYLRPLWAGNKFSSTMSATGKCDGMFINETVEDQEAYNDLVTGLYAKNLKQIAQNKGFAEPFFIRLALEMYDGSYTHITNPILLFPTVNMNSVASWGIQRINTLTLYTYYDALLIKQATDYSDYSDLIKNVVIFASEGINIYDVSTDQPFEKYHPGDDVINSVCRWITEGENYSKYRTQQAPSNYDTFSVLKKRDVTEIVNDIKSTSVFRRICEIGIKPTDEYVNIAEKIDTHTLEFLSTQSDIKYDDYFSRCSLYPEFIYSYNSRLNIANVSRGFFNGFSYFMPWDNETPSDYDFYVTIKTEFGENVIVKQHIDNCYTKQGYYFFYPDSRATNVVIMQGDTKILDAKLTEHHGLNGAYYFAGLPSDSGPERENNQGGSTHVSNDPREQLPNYIIQSEANNPILFLAEGYFKVGTGKIIGMSTITQSLSQGQFGQYPLLAFSESGIWALSVASTGYYDSVHPMSREVCNNAKSIVQTDGAIFFSSEKGLMVIVGNDVKCASPQLSGRETNFTGEISMGNFRDYMLNAIIAYDYRDSLLWIFNNKRSSNTGYCYVYSIKSGTFGKFNFGSYVISNVVNNYPDFLVQDTNGNIRTLTGRPNINNDSRTYEGRIISRPIKLENALALKSIMQIRNIYEMEGSVKLRIFASNNFNNWVELHSLRGTPWKYYRFAYQFENMKATDRFAGTVLITQERRTNKLR